ncbi:helix-turn-helix transcriptional regulator [Amycolatopsis sp. NPDC049253]|uniref:helix-turn-helix domain-containing protein n=1 Tax=Amycolatopsis sp. NPDC049253 TaxID=3155274 RepID=UPI0034293CC9
MTSEHKNDLGRLLQEHRTAKELSVRAAARRAGFSEGRWRQLETGFERRQGAKIPVNPKPLTVVQAADAVDLDAATALQAANLHPNPNFHRVKELQATLEALNYLLAQADEGPTVLANVSQGLKTIRSTASTILDRMPINDHTDQLLSQLKAGMETIDATITDPEEGYDFSIPVNSDLNLASPKSSALIASVQAHANISGSADVIKAPSLSDRLHGLDLDGLKRLRDMVEGAIFAMERPTLEAQLRNAYEAFEFATQESAAIDTMRAHDEHELATVLEALKEAENQGDDTQTLNLRRMASQLESQLNHSRARSHVAAEAKTRARAEIAALQLRIQIAEDHRRELADAEHGEAPER